MPNMSFGSAIIRMSKAERNNVTKKQVGII